MSKAVLVLAEQVFRDENLRAEVLEGAGVGADRLHSPMKSLENWGPVKPIINLRVGFGGD